MDYDDQLPCGGYEDEDKKIQEDIRNASEGKEAGQCCKKVEKEKEEIVIKTVCKKCTKGRAILLHKGDPICQECLFKNMEYKCRLLLQNTFKVKKDSNLLVCLSGGLNSICLLNIMMNLQKRYQKNKLFNRLSCIHIQQQTQLPLQYKTHFQEVTGMKLVVVSIEDAFGRDKGSLEDVRKVLGMFNKSANTIDLVSILRDRLIQDYAEKNGYEYVLKGLNGQALATQTFRYFAKGLGGNLQQLSANDKQRGPFYYPLRNNLQKQIQYYYHINKLANLAIKSNDDNIEYSTTNGLDGQIKQFIDALQNMYSHTAPAIVRTAQKIQSSLKLKIPCCWCRLVCDEGKLCRRCQRLWQSRKGTMEMALLPDWMIVY